MKKSGDQTVYEVKTMKQTEDAPACGGGAWSWGLLKGPEIFRKRFEIASYRMAAVIMMNKGNGRDEVIIMM